MARNGGFNDRNRDGVNDDFDAAPGNRSASASYSRIYDARSETEFSNRLESSAYARQAWQQEAAAAAQADAREAALSAQSRVHVFPSVGKFIIPVENTWAAHEELIKDKDQNLYFRPEKFVYFDKVIADILKIPALTDAKHPDYGKYEGLRNNLAVLRNDVIGIYLDDGSFDPGDEVHIPKIIGIAEAIAYALKSDAWYKRAFVPSLSMDVAGVEATGAREIYKFLLRSQAKPVGMLEPMRQRINAMLGIPNHAWGLPELEKTPFSDAGLSAPPPLHKQCFTPSELSQACAQEMNDMVNLSEKTADNAGRLRSVSSLTPPVRETSVEEARTILRWLRNLQFGEQELEEWLSRGTPPEQVAKAEAISRLVEIYEGEMYKTAQTNAQRLRDLAVDDANTAAGSAALVLSLYSIDILPENHPGIARLESLLAGMPKAWELRETQSLNRFLDTMEDGFARLHGKDIGDLSPTQRLVDMSQRIQETAYRLRSVDTLEAPAREESVELAREILRRLKNLQFSDKPLEELVNYGRPEDKAAFAQKIGEMVDIYKNLLFEAAEANPGILNDPRVKEANDTVGSFAHTITLMASKEIPNSIAAAQKISADVTQMPEEWKDLHHRTVGRLVKSMEGGLEQAVGDLEMQQQEQQAQEEEQSRESADTALLHSDARRRRRRRRQQRSGLGGGKQTKQHLDLTADDYVLRQGRFRDVHHAAPVDRPMVPPMAGIRMEDIAQIRELGGSLRDIGQQAASLSPTEVTPSDKIVPDNKTFAMRDKEQKQSPNNRPRERL